MSYFSILTDIYIAIGRKHGGIGHPNDFYIVGTNGIGVHVVVGIRAIKLQRILLGMRRDELRSSRLHRQQFIHGFCFCVSIERAARAVHMDVVAPHVPFGFLQRAQILIEGEGKVAFRIKIVVTHLLGVEIHKYFVIASKKGFCSV